MASKVRSIERCQHDWVLAEDGYTRTWSTKIADDGTILAAFGGAYDWSEDGDGKMYLLCRTCTTRGEVGDAEIQYL